MRPACPALHTVGGGTGDAASAYKLIFPEEPEKGKRWSVQGVIITRCITVNISVCNSQRERPVLIVRTLNGA